MKKRILAVLTAAVLCMALVLTACGGTDAEETAKDFSAAVEELALPVTKDSADAIMQTEEAKRDSYAIELGIIQDMYESGRINRTQMRQLRRNVYVMQVDAESEL